jgi:hypothetical protein
MPGQASRLSVNGDAREGLSDVRAKLRLNTAELNLFTVALFLLCIGRAA